MRVFLLAAILFCLISCETIDRDLLVYDDAESVPSVYAKAETTPVASLDDAADDPAIWYNHSKPAESLIIGTDKQAGIGVYNLDGQLKQFISAGRPNNVDLRQGLKIGAWQGDLAIASNRDGDVITLFSITADGGKIIGSFPAGLKEPYGACMGLLNNKALVFVTYKTGQVQVHQLTNINNQSIEQELLTTISLSSQLEGCVYDDLHKVLFIGEEEHGLWRTTLGFSSDQLGYSQPKLIDEIGSVTGLAADIEGVSLFERGKGGYIVVSSQGNDSYALYDRQGAHAFKGRFRISSNAETGIDGAQETDGIAADSRSFGVAYPEGILVVQDGFNAPAGQAQNFKIVDWRDIQAVLILK